jgi:hypothetical protein
LTGRRGNREHDRRARHREPVDDRARSGDSVCSAFTSWPVLASQRSGRGPTSRNAVEPSDQPSTEVTYSAMFVAVAVKT